MKNFFQFLSETQSQASVQARKLNLKSDGHGGWLDTRGKFVAKTEDGKLKFVDKKMKNKMIQQQRVRVKLKTNLKLKKLKQLHKKLNQKDLVKDK